jgi:ribosomal protein S18 acetylase RimI-like enzyme
VVVWLPMLSDRALADYDAQIRRSTQADEPGASSEAAGAVVRWVPIEGQGTITWSGLDEGTADAAIAAQVEFFRARRQPFEWKLYDYDQPPDLAGRLLAAGFQPEDTEVLMVAETATALTDVPLPEGVTVREVTGRDGLDQMFRVHELAFDNDGTRLRQALEAQVAQAPQSLGMVIALAGDEPVSAARIEYPSGSDFAGLWGGGTAPGWRGRGLYRALVARRAQMAAARGYRYLQVDALPTSQPILTRLGFVALARTTPYIWEPGPATDTLPA